MPLTTLGSRTWLAPSCRRWSRSESRPPRRSRLKHSKVGSDLRWSKRAAKLRGRPKCAPGPASDLFVALAKRPNPMRISPKNGDVTFGPCRARPLALILHDDQNQLRRLSLLSSYEGVEVKLRSRHSSPSCPVDPKAAIEIPLPVKTRSWVPFLDTYRTMCLAPEPQFQRVLEEIRAWI
jgi:hypothetical protein